MATLWSFRDALLSRNGALIYDDDKCCCSSSSSSSSSQASSSIGVSSLSSLISSSGCVISNWDYSANVGASVEMECDPDGAGNDITPSIEIQIEDPEGTTIASSTNPLEFSGGASVTGNVEVRLQSSPWDVLVQGNLCLPAFDVRIDVAGSDCVGFRVSWDDISGLEEETVGQVGNSGAFRNIADVDLSFQLENSFDPATGTASASFEVEVL